LSPRTQPARAWHRFSRGRVFCAPIMKEATMSWTRPKLREIVVGLEINGYMPSEL
jgi:coenzyme PQQ precursor peptide PqqA